MNKIFFKINKKNKACPAKLWRSGGFTIIETMISISIFLVVVMIGTDSLLNATSIHQKSKDQRSVMDNLTFIMEDMSRNIRTGYSFRCVNTDVNSSNIVATPKSCSGGAGAIIFENSAGDSANIADQWVYKIQSIGADFSIYKSVDGAVTFTQLNPDEIKLDQASGFVVTGAEPSTSTSGDNQQPLVTIKLMGKIVTKGKANSFAIQTTVSQRISDQ